MLNARETKATLIKAAVVTSANVHDKHRQEKQLYGDSACAAQQELIRSTAPKAADLTNPRVRKGNATEKLERLIGRAKSRVRGRGVQHVSGVVKRLWGFDKVLYRGLAKNATRSFVALGLANSFLAPPGTVWKSPPVMGAKRANNSQCGPKGAAEQRNAA